MNSKFQHINKAKGIALIDSAILAGLICLVVIIGARALGVKLRDNFLDLGSSIDLANGGTISNSSGGGGSPTPAPTPEPEPEIM